MIYNDTIGRQAGRPHVGTRRYVQLLNFITRVGHDVHDSVPTSRYLPRYLHNKQYFILRISITIHLYLLKTTMGNFFSFL